MSTERTGVSIETFLETVSEKRRAEAQILIALMHKISNMEPYMWGPTIIAFGTQHYKYESGREGDMPQLAFSPRKASLTVYFNGFDDFTDELATLGKYKQSKACLYINKLEDVDLEVLHSMLEKSFRLPAKS